MKHVLLFVASVTFASILYSQGHPVDWPVFGGDAQRTGWEKSDTRITRENAKDLELLYAHKFAGKRTGPRALTPPAIVGMLISYRGFKELAFLSDSSDNIWALDADLQRVFWQRHFDVASKSASSACAKFATAMPGLVPPTSFGAPKAAGPRRPALSGNRFGEVRPVYAVASDGKLHKLNTSNGDDLSPALNFLPAGAKASPLTIHDGTVYASTLPGCGATSGIYAIDLTAAAPVAVSFTGEGKDAPALGTPAFGTDGTVYVPTSANTVLVFTPNDLKLKGHFGLPAGALKKGGVTNIPAPVVFPYKGHDVVVTTAADGSLVLWDGEADHAPLYRTPPVASSPQAIRGGLSSWEDPDGARWVLAPVWGKVGTATSGAIVAFKLDEANGKPVLTQAWVSRDIPSPQPPVTTGGVIFALSAGSYSDKGQPRGSSHATLYALDAVTGEELYSSGDKVKGPATLTGLTLANGRVFFTTNDNTLWVFGAHFEI